MQVIQRKNAIASFQSNETHGCTGSATASSYEASPVLPRLSHQKQQASLCCSVRTAREQGSALGLSPKVHSYAGIDLVRFLFGRNNKRLKPGHNVGRVVKNKDSKYTTKTASIQQRQQVYQLPSMSHASISSKTAWL